MFKVRTLFLWFCWCGGFIVWMIRITVVKEAVNNQVNSNVSACKFCVIKIVRMQVFWYQNDNCCNNILLSHRGRRLSNCMTSFEVGYVLSEKEERTSNIFSTSLEKICYSFIFFSSLILPLPFALIQLLGAQIFVFSILDAPTTDPFFLLTNIF